MSNIIFMTLNFVQPQFWKYSVLKLKKLYKLFNLLARLLLYMSESLQIKNSIGDKREQVAQLLMGW